MFDATRQQSVPLLGKLIGHVLTEDEAKQISGGRWWTPTEPTIDNDEGEIRTTTDPLSPIWVY